MQIKAASKVPCSRELAARVALDTGKVLWFYTQSTRLARLHLENSVCFFGLFLILCLALTRPISNVLSMRNSKSSASRSR